MRTIALVFLLIGFLSCNKKEYSKQVTWEYKYEVICDKSNDLFIRYVNTSGDESNVKSAPSGWVYSWTSTLMVDENGVPVENAWILGLRHLYVSACSNTTTSVSITTRIWRNGSKVVEQIKTGSEVTSISEGNF